MINKYLVSSQSEVLQQKLKSLLGQLSINSSTNNLQTQEVLLQEAMAVLKTFYSSPEKSIFKSIPVQSMSLPDGTFYNNLWNNILADLTVLFSSLENIETIAVDAFNTVQADIDRVINRLKKVSSLVGDYALFTENIRDAFYFSDSFNDLSKIDIGSIFLANQECSIDQDQGIVILPIDTSQNPVLSSDITVTINSASNGTAGNNQELGVPVNSNSNSILDNNPDTWFEYEKVLSSTDTNTNPLILDMSFTLKTPSIINSIRINPNNFGTKTIIEIKDISTSEDGLIYTSIKDDIPISNFLTIDEPNIFLLAPSTSKYAGQGFYTFNPRTVKYIHFVFSQSESYPITTGSGIKQRYAIGLRDIELLAYIYLSQGDLISQSFTLTDEIKKVSISTTQTPIQNNELVSIDYSISPDEGQTWFPIQQTGINGISGQQSSIPEILNFNSVDEKAINTNSPVTSLKVKLSLSRNDTNFDNNTNFLSEKGKQSISELYTISNSSPYSFELNNIPIQDTLKVIDPAFGSKGIPEAPYLVSGTETLGGTTTSFFLPLSGIKQPISKATLVGGTYVRQNTASDSWIYCMVGGERWLHAVQPLTSYSANYSTDTQYKLFTFNPSNGQLSFGNGNNTVSPISPGSNNLITLYFAPEQVYPLSDTNGHIFTLEYPTSNNKNNIQIMRYEDILGYLEKVPTNTSTIKLQKQNIVSTTNISSILTGLGFTTQKTFLNGKDELTTAASWSIDIINGVIYLGAATSAAVDSNFTYTAQTVTTLTNDDWDWKDIQGLQTKILIKDSAWLTRKQENLSLVLTEGAFLVELANLNIVNNSIDFELVDSSRLPITNDLDPLLQEVPFVDGLTELGIKQNIVINKIGKAILPYDLSNNYTIYSFDLDGNITDTPTQKISFSRTDIFKTLIGTVPTGGSSIGDYYVERDPLSPNYKKVSVKLTVKQYPWVSNTLYDLGQVSYFANIINNNRGLFSVDYQNGVVYTQRPFDSTWVLNTSYEYTDFRVKYEIAREVPFTYDSVNQLVILSDSEVVNKLKLPRGTNVDRLTYQVMYDFISTQQSQISPLKQYFSPIVKDYSLKVLTKSQLIG
jgi:hypothetical protein